MARPHYILGPDFEATVLDADVSSYLVTEDDVDHLVRSLDLSEVTTIKLRVKTQSQVFKFLRPDRYPTLIREVSIHIKEGYMGLSCMEDCFRRAAGFVHDKVGHMKLEITGLAGPVNLPAVYGLAESRINRLRLFSTEENDHIEVNHHPTGSMSPLILKMLTNALEFATDLRIPRKAFTTLLSRHSNTLLKLEVCAADLNKGNYEAILSCTDLRKLVLGSALGLEPQTLLRLMDLKTLRSLTVSSEYLDIGILFVLHETDFSPPLPHLLELKLAVAQAPTTTFMHLGEMFPELELLHLHVDNMNIDPPFESLRSLLRMCSKLKALHLLGIGVLPESFQDLRLPLLEDVRVRTMDDNEDVHPGLEAAVQTATDGRGWQEYEPWLWGAGPDPKI